MRTINEIGERHGIPETTARRYTKRFAEFLSGRKVGNAVKYPSEDEELILKIARLYDEGESTEEIREILAGEHSRTLEVEGSDSPRANTPQLLTAAFMAQTQALQQLADTLEDMQKQQEDIEELKEEQRKLEKRLEERDQKLVQHMRERLEKEKPSTFWEWLRDRLNL